MAAPHVAGTAALLRSVAPGLPAPTVAAMLVATAEPLKDVVPGSAGAGLVNPVAALDAALGPLPPPPPPTTTAKPIPAVTRNQVLNMTLPKDHFCA